MEVAGREGELLPRETICDCVEIRTMELTAYSEQSRDDCDSSRNSGSKLSSPSPPAIVSVRALDIRLCSREAARHSHTSFVFWERKGSLFIPIRPLLSLTSSYGSGRERRQ